MKVLKHPDPEIGAVHGRLTVVGAVRLNQRQVRVAPCQCRCGNAVEVPVCKLVSWQAVMCLACSRSKARRFLRGGPR